MDERLAQHRQLARVIGWIVWGHQWPHRDRRGLSQSTEIAILLAAALVIAGLIVGIVTPFVRSKLQGF
jgi:hypothetical protein